MTELAVWTGEDVAEAETPADFGAASWLPPSVQRAQALEDVAERRVARAAERERAERAEAAADRALNAYRAAAESRGEVVSAMQIARGENIGRSLGDVFAGALAAAEMEDARSDARDRRQEYLGAGEPVVRSAWPATEYEADSMIARAEDNRRWMVGYMARRDYPAARDAARAKAERGHVSRSGHSGYASSGEIVRGCDAGFTIR